MIEKSYDFIKKVNFQNLYKLGKKEDFLVIFVLQETKNSVLNRTQDNVKCHVK